MTGGRKLTIMQHDVPSINKGKYACQRVFPALFALFALVGASPPASQKPKITRKSIAGRCLAVLSEQKCVQTRKGPQRILAVLSRDLTQYGRISARQNRVCPCQSMVFLVAKQIFAKRESSRHKQLLSSLFSFATQGPVAGQPFHPRSGPRPPTPARSCNLRGPAVW